MSTRDRLRDEAKRRRRKGPRAQEEVFAAMRADALLDAILRHAPRGAAGRIAVRALVLAHAAWKPGPHGLADGAAVLPHKVIARPLRRSRTKPVCTPSGTTIGAALARLTDAGDLVLASPGTAPSRAGGGRGDAASYRVPARHGADAPRLDWRWKNLPRPQGSIRLHVQHIRHDCWTLSPVALCLLLLAVALHDRRRDGAIADPKPFGLPLETLAELLGVSVSTLAAARAELVAKGRLLPVGEASGRRPAMFMLATAYVRHSARAEVDLA